MKKLLSIGVGLIAACGWSQAASAQESGLASMEVGQLRPEVQRRYDEALAATQSPEILSATDSRHMWASGKPFALRTLPRYDVDAPGRSGTGGHTANAPTAEHGL